MIIWGKVNCPQRGFLKVAAPVKRCAPAHQRALWPTALIVDDHALVRRAIRAGLESDSGFVVCGEAVDGMDAIAKAPQLKPDFILLDLSMSGINGVEIASVLKRLMPQVPIVAFSWYAELLGKSLAATVGIDAAVAKSEGMGKVIECVQGLLGLA